MKNIDIIKHKNYNIKIARYKIGETNILLLSIYMPTTGKDEEFNKMCDEINDIICREATDSYVIGFGDLNIRHDQNRPRNKKMLNTLNNLNLELITPKTTTHKSHRHGTYTTLDYFFCSKNITVEDIKVLDLEHFQENRSSHYPIILECTLETIHRKEKKDKTKKKGIFESHRKINWDNLDKNLYQKLVDTALKQLDTHNLGLESKMKATTDILVMMAKIASPKSINESHNTYKDSKEKRNLKRTKVFAIYFPFQSM